MIKNMTNFHLLIRFCYFIVTYLSFSANLINLLYDLQERSPTVQQQLLQNRGFLVISYQMEKVFFELKFNYFIIKLNYKF